MRGLMNRVAVAAMLTAALAGGITMVTLRAVPAGAADQYTPQLETASVADAKFPAAVEGASPAGTIATKKEAVILAVKAKSLTKRPTAAARTAGSEQARAQILLNQFISRYPILKGTTVTFGNARGYQAISYYQTGKIIVSSSHTASLERIMAHEIWHIIDWRDNNVINWGENVPPR